MLGLCNIDYQQPLGERFPYIKIDLAPVGRKGILKTKGWKKNNNQQTVIKWTCNLARSEMGLQDR